HPARTPPRRRGPGRPAPGHQQQARGRRGHVGSPHRLDPTGGDGRGAPAAAPSGGDQRPHRPARARLAGPHPGLGAAGPRTHPAQDPETAPGRHQPRRRTRHRHAARTLPGAATAGRHGGGSLMSDAIIIGENWISEHYFASNSKESFTAQVREQRKYWDDEEKDGVATVRSRFTRARSVLLAAIAALEDASQGDSTTRADHAALRALYDQLLDVLGFTRPGLIREQSGP